MNRDVAAAAVWADHPGEFLELTLVDVITDSPGPSLPAAHRIQNLYRLGARSGTGQPIGCQFNGGELPVVGVKSGMINAFCAGAARSEKDVYGSAKPKEKNEETRVVTSRRGRVFMRRVYFVRNVLESTKAWMNSLTLYCRALAAVRISLARSSSVKPKGAGGS